MQVSIALSRRRLHSGCPPRPEALLYGLMRLQDIIMREAPSAYIFDSDGTVTGDGPLKSP